MQGMLRCHVCVRRRFPNGHCYCTVSRAQADIIELAALRGLFPPRDDYHNLPKPKVK